MSHPTPRRMELERAADGARDLLAGIDDLMREKGAAYALGQASVALKVLVRAADAALVTSAA